MKPGLALDELIRIYRPSIRTYPLITQRAGGEGGASPPWRGAAVTSTFKNGSMWS